MKFAKVTIQTSDDGSNWSDGPDAVVELPATPERIAELSAEVAGRLEKLSANAAANG